MRIFRPLCPPLGLVVLFSACLAAGPQDFLPPARPWHGASEALIAKADNPWITPAEKTGLTDSPSYDDTMAWLKKLCAATPLMKMVTDAVLLSWLQQLLPMKFAMSPLPRLMEPPEM